MNTLYMLHRNTHFTSITSGMDASVTPIPEEPGLSLVQTTDFFYPLVDDPYLQVRTAFFHHDYFN